MCFSREMRSFVTVPKLFPANVVERAKAKRHPQIPGAISLEMNVNRSCRWDHCLVFGVLLKFVLDDTVLLRRLLDCQLPLLWGEQDCTT